MTDRWSRPGLIGALLYGVLAAVVGTVATGLTRLRIERDRGLRRVAQRLPSGPIIVISNHTSYADGVLLVLACRRLGRSLRMLATAGVFRVPVIGGIARRLGFIAVRRGSADAAGALDAARQALAAGEAVGLFPEGRVTRDPQNWPEQAKTGAVRLALATGAPIVPVAMVGAHDVVGKTGLAKALLRAAVRRPKVRVEVGDAIDVRRLAGVDGDGAAGVAPAVVRQLTDDVMAALVNLIAKLRGERAAFPSGVPSALVGDAGSDTATATTAG